MSWKTTALLGVAALAVGAAPLAQAASAKVRSGKASPAKSAAPSAARAAAPAAFDARDPASLAALLGALDAKAETTATAEGDVRMKVTTPNYGFSVQFAGCDASGKACKGLAFDTFSNTRTVGLTDLNAFNQTSLACRAWQDKAGKPHVTYSTLVFANDSREEMREQLGAWQGCLASFGEFLVDPPGYLASAP